jgi:hypothetical protein
MRQTAFLLLFIAVVDDDDDDDKMVEVGCSIAASIRPDALKVVVGIDQDGYWERFAVQ